MTQQGFTGAAQADRTGQPQARLSGQVVYLFAFDLAYEMRPLPGPTLLGQPLATFAVGGSKRAPRHLTFYRPQMIRLPPVERIGPRGLVRLEPVVKLLPVGAISISFRMGFEVERLEHLVAYHDLHFGDGSRLSEHARDLAEQLRQALLPQLVRPRPTVGDDEAYTAFCINGPLAATGDGQSFIAEEWLFAHRRQIASVLTEEADPNYLSQQEADESSARYFSYSQSDVVIIDWDAAMIVDEPSQFEQVLYLMELCNLQLTELEAYDRILDTTIEASYRDLVRGRWRGWHHSRTQRDLREIRIDLARVSDELENISKFFGDWHLARIYQGLAARFHLGDWHHSIDKKLKTLDDIYQLLNMERTNRMMVVLEAAIVAMFLFEIIKSFL